MYISTRYTVAFILPEEYDLWQGFLKNDDIDTWRENITTGCAAYTKEAIYSTEVNRYNQSITAEK